MTTFSAAYAPRGLDFVFSAKRFDVATSRARCLVVLVANPGLRAAECLTPERMRLVNAGCAYLERVAGARRHATKSETDDASSQSCVETTAPNEKLGPLALGTLASLILLFV
jgi:hypothetical protein